MNNGHQARLARVLAGITALAADGSEHAVSMSLGMHFGILFAAERHGAQLPPQLAAQMLTSLSRLEAQVEGAVALHGLSRSVEKATRRSCKHG